VINVIPAVLVFSICKIVRPVDAGKIVNSAQHPKSLGTAALIDFIHLHWIFSFNNDTTFLFYSNCRLHSQRKKSFKSGECTE